MVLGAQAEGGHVRPTGPAASAPASPCAPAPRCTCAAAHFEAVEEAELGGAGVWHQLSQRHRTVLALRHHSAVVRAHHPTEHTLEACAAQRPAVDRKEVEDTAIDVVVRLPRSERERLGQLSDIIYVYTGLDRSLKTEGSVRSSDAEV